MKVLEAITILSTNNLTLLSKIQLALEERMDWLNDREPESSGMVYDAWSEKVDDLQEILDNIENLIDEKEVNAQQELIEEIQSNVDMYQAIHGGLSRLKL